MSRLMNWGPDEWHSDRFGWGPSLNGVSRWRISDSLLLSIWLHVPTQRFEWQHRIRLWAYVPFDRSRRGWRYPCPEVNGVRGDPGGWLDQRATSRISYPILLANICANDGGMVDSETPCPAHWERSIMANISSEPSSSSTAKVCSAGLWILTDGLRLAKSVHTSINVWSFWSFWVRITIHKYFLSSGSDCPRTNCSLINYWRSSGELCG